jgi:hypothetical protein
MFQNRASLAGWDQHVAATFGTQYPQNPHALSHAFTSHPLLHRTALAHAAAHLPDMQIECRSADSQNGEGFPMVVLDRDQRLSLIENASDDRVWTMIRGLEDLPEYDALLHSIMAPFQGSIAQQTGMPNSLKSFIFMSPPGALTPLHFDAEWNILLQLSGQKTFSILPPISPWLTLDQQEIYHASGDNLLPWHDHFAADAQHYCLQAGDAVFVPYKAPHWVTVGDASSISLSITWRTTWCDDQDDAARMAALMRRRGLPVEAPGPWPGQHRGMAFSYRALRKLGAV